MKCKTIVETLEGKKVEWKTCNAYDKMQVVRVDLPKVKPIFVMFDRDAKEIVAMKQRVGAIPNGIYNPLGDNISLCTQEWYDTLQKPKERRKLVDALKHYITEAMTCSYKRMHLRNQLKRSSYSKKAINKILKWYLRARRCKE